MRSRPKTFLAFCLLSIVPLLVISLLSFLGNLKFEENLLRADLENEISVATNGFDLLLSDRKTELQDLAGSPAMRKYISAEQAPATRPTAADFSGTAGASPASSSALTQVAVESGNSDNVAFNNSGRGARSPSQGGGKPLSSSSGGQLPAGNEEESEVRDKIVPLLRHRFYSTIALFSPNKRLLFVAESPQPQGNGDLVFRTTNFLPDQIQPDDAVWTTGEQRPLCTIATQATLGNTLRCTLPVFVWEQKSSSRGALVADLKLDSLVAPTAGQSELARSRSGVGTTTPRAIVVVLDDSGGIVYHTNDAHKHQPVASSMPYFAEVANSMVAGQSGTKFYTSSERDRWLAAYAPLMRNKLSIAIAGNYSLLTSNTRRLGWLSVVFALFIGAGAALLLSHYYLRKTQSIDRVAEGVGAIAKGKLDYRIELQSSDDLRPLADNLGLMTRQLRDQLAREAETRQFQSFVRLSAILTHDLKNAIEALSLTVANMERHFDNKDFRADAMQSVTGATDNLRALVERLSNPVTTLSGEHKRPRPVDLVPMLRRVIAMIAEPASGKHEIKISLPESLYALVDIERMNKVVENLIINALEAMTREKGTLSIVAGNAADGKPFFSVGDTGEGMSPRFIQEKLFHPFATTKRRGVGLGLYTCREVVVANGGSIEVESEEGVGTTFRVVLPSAALDSSGINKPQGQPPG